MVFYNNIDQDAVKRKLDIAIANKKKTTEERELYNRERELYIQQPPADFRTFEEASANAGYQNALAIKILKTFLYQDDVTAAFSELLKNNQINQFNQYSEVFKKLIGARHISYIEFLSIWNNFTNYKNINPENSPKELFTSEESYRKLGLKNQNLNQMMNEDKHIFTPEQYKILKAGEKKIKNENIKIKLLEGLIRENKLRDYDKEGDKIKLKKLKENRQRVEENIKNQLMKYEDINIKNKDIDNPLPALPKVENNDLIYKILTKHAKETQAKYPKKEQAKKALSPEVEKEQLKILNFLTKNAKITPSSQAKKALSPEAKKVDYMDELKKSIAESIKRREEKRMASGGFHRIRGRGLNSDSSLIHRFNILKGEVLAGNDNIKVITEIKELINNLKSKNLLVSS